MFRAIGCRFGTTDGCSPSSNGRLISDQQYLIIISFISLIDLLTVYHCLPVIGLTLCCIKHMSHSRSYNLTAYCKCDRFLFCSFSYIQDNYICATLRKCALHRKAVVKNELSPRRHQVRIKKIRKMNLRRFSRIDREVKGK